MRFARTILAAAVLALPLATQAQSAAVVVAQASAPNVRMKAGEVELRAKVVELDAAARTATLRGPKDRVVTVNVPAEIKNFDQVQVGDELVIRYIAAVAARLEPASKSGIRERVESGGAKAAAPGAMPAAGGARTVEVLATITALDRKAGTATLRGVKRSVTLKVPEGVDITKLKVGDEVRAVFTEAVVVNVERVPAAK
jgi:hypothetical protein